MRNKPRKEKHMLNKLVQWKIVILIVCTAVIIILWMLTLIFGNGEDKIKVLVLSLVLPLMIYGFARLMFRTVRIASLLKYIKTGIYFFLIMGVFGVVMFVIYFITGFPNGLSPSLTACLGLIMAVLDEAKKNIEVENKQ